MVTSAAPRRIVVVDGNDRFRDRLIRRLQRDGHHVCEAVDPPGAVQLARTLKLDTAIIGDPPEAAADVEPAGLRDVVGLAIRVTDRQLERRDNYDIVLRRTFDLDPLCLILLGDYVAAAQVISEVRPAGSCSEEIRTGMRCVLESGHAGLHRWTSPDTERSFLWG